MKKILIFILLIFVAFLYFNSNPPCNKKGTLAHQINWAGHNCEEPEISKKLIKRENIKKIDKVSKKAKKAFKKWIEKSAEEGKKEEIKKVKEEEDDYYKKELEIEACYSDAQESLDKNAINNWTYIHNISSCKKDDLILANCYYEEDKTFKKECEDNANIEAKEYLSDLKTEMWTSTPEEKAERRLKEVNKKRKAKEELKGTIKEALQELRD